MLCYALLRYALRSAERVHVVSAPERGAGDGGALGIVLRDPRPCDGTPEQLRNP